MANLMTPNRWKVNCFHVSYFRSHRNRRLGTWMYEYMKCLCSLKRSTGQYKVLFIQLKTLHVFKEFILLYADNCA